MYNSLSVFIVFQVQLMSESIEEFRHDTFVVCSTLLSLVRIRDSNPYMRLEDWGKTEIK